MSKDMEVGGLGDTSCTPSTSPVSPETTTDPLASTRSSSNTGDAVVVVHPQEPEDDGPSSLMVLQADSVRAPASLLGHRWHPTQALLRTRTTTGGGGKEEEEAVTFRWDARSHRKLRFLQAVVPSALGIIHQKYHPASLWNRLSLWCWEPRIITWYNILIGCVANTLWVVNGLYATWPETSAMASASNPEHISYATGVVGAFLFIVTGYLGYVEALNQTHATLRVPTIITTTEKDNETRNNNNNNNNKRGRFRRPPYAPHGQWKHPLSHYLTSVPGDGANEDDEEEEPGVLHRRRQRGYRWWTWAPDLHYIGVLNALVFFVSTIVFFIPAAAWLPMAKHGAPLASTVFWVYVLQIIPSIGFIFVGHAAMAEASGSWIRPHHSIGWYASLFNTIGGYGFLLYPVLYLPAEVGDPGCCDELAKWGASLATFWGSCAFWIAGILQWIEFCSQHRI